MACTETLVIGDRWPRRGREGTGVQASCFSAPPAPAEGARVTRARPLDASAAVSSVKRGVTVARRAGLPSETPVACPRSAAWGLPWPAERGPCAALSAESPAPGGGGSGPPGRGTRACPLAGQHGHRGQLGQPALRRLFICLLMRLSRDCPGEDGTVPGSAALPQPGARPGRRRQSVRGGRAPQKVPRSPTPTGGNGPGRVG